MSLLSPISLYQAFYVLLGCCLFPAAVDAVFVVPPPSGVYGVALNTMKMTDKNRLDPYSPTHQNRSVMLSVFYPVGPLSTCNSRVVDYMPMAAAQIQDEFYAEYGIPSGTFETLRLSVCKAPLHTEIYPLILFSPGLGNSRLIYSALGQSLASHGYTVVTIDHPYDANVVEYPDGTLVLAANITTNAQIEAALDVRVKDVSFILQQLSHSSVVKTLMPSARASLNTSHVLIAGHSLGGATAAAAMLSESPIMGGVNLDGTFFGPVIQKGLKKPLLVFGHEGKNQSNDATWKDIWKELRGWRRELGLGSSQHATFTDLPVLVDVLGLREVLPGANTVLGSIGGERARKIVSTYLAAFETFVGKGIKSPLLEGSVKGYPEVEVIAK